MHPELQLLEQRYRSLVEDVNAGHVTADDAMVTLSGMVAIDASGATWSIDPYTGQFTRALPGSAPATADPSLFAPASSPSSAPDFGVYAPPPAAGYPAPGSVGLPGESWEAPGSAPMGRAPSLGSPKRRMGGLGASLSGMLSGRGRVIAVVAAAVLAVLALALFRPSAQVADPAGEQAASPSASPGASESDAPSPSASPSASAKLPVPDQARRDALVRTLTAGVRPEVLKQVDPKANTTRVLLSTAPLAGAVRLGFIAKAGEVSATSPGQATLKIVVSSASGPLQTYAVPLVRVDNAWLIGSSVSVVK